MRSLFLLIFGLCFVSTLSETVENSTASSLIADDLEVADSYMRPMYANYSTPYAVRSPTPYDVTPGMYSKESYGGNLVGWDKMYNPTSIYYSYLAHPAYSTYNKNCRTPYGGNAVITKQALNQAFGYAIAHLNRYKQQESSMYAKGNYIRAPYTSAAARAQVQSYGHGYKHQKMYQGMFMEAVSRFLMKHYCLNPVQTNFVLPNMNMVDVVASGYVDYKCRYAYGLPVPPSERCGAYATSRWRPIDGTCNNLKHKYWGRSHVCHLSLLPKAYDDGISHPRTKSLYGSYDKLPPVRLVANEMHHPLNSRAYYTNMKMQFGQWINHDVTQTPQVLANYNGVIECCKNPYHPECFPIFLMHDDYQKKYGRQCMNFVRSSPCPLCVAGPRQQTNIQTSYADLSTVYGATKEDAIRLRSYAPNEKGWLKYSIDARGYQIMPVTSNPYNNNCKGPHLCFDAGDARVNQHPGLMTLHTIWLRQHNRLADKLNKLYPNWNGDRIYETVRQINIAIFQHIMYREYIPIALGPEIAEWFGLTDKPYRTKYNPYTDPTTWNEYATASCRFGHSQIPDFFSMTRGCSGYGNYSQGYNHSGYWLRDNFFNPSWTHNGMTDESLGGLTCDHAMTSDPWIENDVRNYLYRDKAEPGLDLAATNLQRGRDHGIPGYVYYLEYCFNHKVYNWNDLARFIPYYQLQKLKYLYKGPKDIDLYAGGLSERKVTDGDIGPTFSCINGIQWHHLKYGDRYFYTHGYQAGSLTDAQLADIKQMKLSDLICLNSYLDEMQVWAFFPHSSYNKMINCKALRAHSAQVKCGGVSIPYGGHDVNLCNWNVGGY